MSLSPILVNDLWRLVLFQSPNDTQILSVAGRWYPPGFGDLVVGPQGSPWPSNQRGSQGRFGKSETKHLHFGMVKFLSSSHSFWKAPYIANGGHTARRRYRSSQRSLS